VNKTAKSAEDAELSQRRIDPLRILRALCALGGLYPLRSSTTSNKKSRQIITGIYLYKKLDLTQMRFDLLHEITLRLCTNQLVNHLAIFNEKDRRN
jgi:hypothetical protein